MWRFVLVSFGMLAVTFYELSGGADYAPAPNSIQVRADLVRPQARPAPEGPGRRARTLAGVDAAIDGLAKTRTDTRDLSVTLASARTDSMGSPVAGRPEAGGDRSVEAAIAAAIGKVVVDPAQIRRVKDSRVELRAGPGLSFDRITTLAKGVEVGILDDPGHGWLKVRVMDGQASGWLAGWLLTAAQ